MNPADDEVSTMMVALALARRALAMLPEEIPRELAAAIDTDLEQAINRLRWWRAECDLDRLLAQSDWAHPAQILPQPYASFEDILHVLELRLIADPSGDETDPLIHTRERLAKIIQINRTAADRRERKKPR